MSVQLTLLSYICFLLFAPILSLILALLYVYRCFVHVILKIQFGDKFAGLLDGTDYIWAIEDPSALSVINVLSILEKDPRHYSGNFLESFRNLVEERLLRSTFDKLLYKRCKKYGYYYWEKCAEVSVAERVRWIDHVQSTCDGSCGNVYAESWKKTIRSIANQPLPQDHSVSWEILIGRTCPRSNFQRLRRMEEGMASAHRMRKSKIKVPIIFRVHHTLGDGVALLRLLVESIADRDVMRESMVEIENEECAMRHENGYEEISVPVPQLSICEKHVLDSRQALNATMPFTYPIVLGRISQSLQRHVEMKLKFLQHCTSDELIGIAKTFVENKLGDMKNVVSRLVSEKIRSFVQVVAMLIAMPTFVVEQAVRSMDNSALHGPLLSGEKMIAYWMESDFRTPSDEKLLMKIRYIKNVTGARFGDIILAALSSSLHKYLLSIHEAVPRGMTVVVPLRMEEPNKEVPLQNGFSVGLLPLCLSSVNGQEAVDPNKNLKILDRLCDISKANDKLREGPDYTINFWIMKYISAALPENILKPLLASYSTMVFSNLQGSAEVRILGNTLKNVVFWVPNRSSTGIGCAVLSYGGNMHLSLVADKSLMKDEQHLTEILQNTISEIDNLHDHLTASCLSKKFQCITSAPMKEGVGVLQDCKTE